MGAIRRQQSVLDRSEGRVRNGTRQLAKTPRVRDRKLARTNQQTAKFSASVASLSGWSWPAPVVQRDSATMTLDDPNQFVVVRLLHEPNGVEMKLVLVAVASIFLAGCASGSALVTGQTRPALEDHTTVSILTTMPNGAEEIAIVKASSDSGLTQQGSLDYAVEELNKQAANVGANAVVLTGRDTSSQTVGVPVYGGGTAVSSSEVEIVQGIAIWVEP